MRGTNLKGEWILVKDYLEVDSNNYEQVSDWRVDQASHPSWNRNSSSAVTSPVRTASTHCLVGVYENKMLVFVAKENGFVSLRDFLEGQKFGRPKCSFTNLSEKKASRWGESLSAAAGDLPFWMVIGLFKNGLASTIPGWDTLILRDKRRHTQLEKDLKKSPLRLACVGRLTSWRCAT